MPARIFPLRHIHRSQLNNHYETLQWMEKRLNKFNQFLYLGSLVMHDVIDGRRWSANNTADAVLSDTQNKFHKTALKPLRTSIQVNVCLSQCNNSSCMNSTVKFPSRRDGDDNAIRETDDILSLFTCNWWEQAHWLINYLDMLRTILKQCHRSDSMKVISVILLKYCIQA